VTPDDLPIVRLAIGRTELVEPLLRSTDGGPVRQTTRVELLDEGDRLSIAFHCVDTHPWATLSARDDDLWTEEVVELFVAPGEETPTTYFELEANPLGALFDARIENLHGDRTAFSLDRGWTCAGLASAVDRTAEGWRVLLSVPWSSIDPQGAEPRLWRLNLFRIDRPPDGPAEFSAWSPTHVDPPDFHRPARFGLLERLR